MNAVSSASIVANSVFESVAIFWSGKLNVVVSGLAPAPVRNA